MWILEKRIIDLEVKFSFQEDLLAELNEIVTKQQFTIDKLQREMQVIQSTMESGDGAENRSLKDDIPPHY
ncbi:MAG: SlyX protein [Bacteriovoracaceae bacterium]|jgi:SlyX protein